MLTKLNEVYENWATGDGVFTDLNEFDVPWKDTEHPEIILNLNMAYHGAHSGDKNVSPVVYKFLKSEDENTRAKLAKIIYTMFADKWAKLWALMEIEYNPLNNYDMEEHETPAEITHTVTPAETTVETKPPKIVSENDVSAFNSSDYSDATKTITTGDNNDKGTESINVDTAGNDVLTVQNDRVLTRSGNIGVMSSQALAQSEIELRKWLYYQSVFSDIDNILTLSIY